MKRDISEKEIKKILKNTNRSEEQKEIKKFIIILLGVCILVIGIYFLTKNVVEKKQAKEDTQKTEVNFDYSKIILGELLNRPYEEYYVMVYNLKDAHANYYTALASKYATNKGDSALKVYTADLNDSMNKKFYSKKESNPNATSVAELKVKDLTLIKVKNGNIVKYLEDTDSIKQEFGI